MSTNIPLTPDMLGAVDPEAIKKLLYGDRVDARTLVKNATTSEGPDSASKGGGSSLASTDQSKPAPQTMSQRAAVKPTATPSSASAAPQTTPAAGGDTTQPAPEDDRAKFLNSPEGKAAVGTRPSDVKPYGVWRRMGLGLAGAAMDYRRGPGKGFETAQNAIAKNETEAKQAETYDKNLPAAQNAAYKEHQEQQTRSGNIQKTQAEIDKDKAEAEKDRRVGNVAYQHVVIEGPDGNPKAALFDKNSGSYVDPDTHDVIQGAKPFTKAEKTPEHEIKAVTLQTPDGKKIPGKVAFDGSLLTEDGKPAPHGTMLFQQPNYGQMILPTKTVTTINPETGVQTVMSWNEKTGAYDIPQGTSATGAIGHEMGQAAIVERSGTRLISEIQRNKGDLGSLSAWVQKYGLNTPIADPGLARLQSRLATFAALQPSMHGFRSATAMEAFQNIIGGLQKNPDATIASIEAIMDTAQDVNPTLNRSGQGKAADGAPTPQTHVFDLGAWKRDNPGKDSTTVEQQMKTAGYDIKQ